MSAFKIFKRKGLESLPETVDGTILKWGKLFILSQVHSFYIFVMQRLSNQVWSGEYKEMGQWHGI